jgi:hypothetical protein
MNPTGESCGCERGKPARIAMNCINPEFALGISEKIGGRVKRVKKVKCYNQAAG